MNRYSKKQLQKIEDKLPSILTIVDSSNLKDKKAVSKSIKKIVKELKAFATLEEVSFV